MAPIEQAFVWIFTVYLPIIAASLKSIYFPDLQSCIVIMTKHCQIHSWMSSDSVIQIMSMDFLINIM